MKTLSKILLTAGIFSTLTFNSRAQNTKQVTGGFIEYNEKEQIIRKEFEKPEYNLAINFEYDAEERIIKERYSYDINKDKKTDKIEIWKYEYNKDNQKTKEIFIIDSDADEKNDTIETRVYSYSGNKRKTTIFYDNNADGKTDKKEKF